jgi:hypothetical protein
MVLWVGLVEFCPRLEEVRTACLRGRRTVLHVIERSWPRSAFGSMSHHLGWMRDCRTAVGCRPNFLAPHFCRTKGRLMQPSHASSIEHDLAAVCRKGTLSADLVTLFRRSLARRRASTVGRRQPADMPQSTGGSTDAMDPRSVPSSVVESSAVGSRAMAERLVLCVRRRLGRRYVGVRRIADGVADVRRKWRDRLEGSSRSDARRGRAGVARGVGGALGPRARRGSVVATRRPPTGLLRSVRNDRRTGDRDGTNVRSRERRV